MCNPMFSEVYVNSDWELLPGARFRFRLNIVINYNGRMI